MNAMSSLETRHVSRDSLFLFAQLTFEGRSDSHRVKVRNLSAGGMMAEVDGFAVSRGDRLVIELRNVGSVSGSVAWAQANRFGVAFESEIDPKIVRAPTADVQDQRHYAHRRPLMATLTDEERRLRNL